MSLAVPYLTAAALASAPATVSLRKKGRATKAEKKAAKRARHRGDVSMDPQRERELAAMGKWCGHCRKSDHNDSECWSTRAVPSPWEVPAFDATKPCDMERIARGEKFGWGGVPTMCMRCKNPHHKCDSASRSRAPSGEESAPTEPDA